MADLRMQVTITRVNLALGPLDINDHVNYALAPGSLGGQTTWNRQTSSSPFMDDDITITRRRGKVQEPVVIEVYGDSIADVQVNADTLIRAATQDTFDLSIEIEGVSRVYAAEAADYQMAFVGSRFIAKQLQVVLTIPRSPIPKVGVF